MRIVKRHRCIRVAAVAALLGAAGAAHAGIWRHDRDTVDHQLIGRNYPVVGSLAVEPRFDDEPYGLFAVPTCSGTVIAPQWILTAGHCTEAFGDPNAEDYFILFTNNGSATSGFLNMQFQQADYWVSHPEWDGDLTKGNDIGLVRLSTPVTDVAPATLYAGNAEIGREVTMVGYGSTGDGTTGEYENDGRRRGGPNIIDLDGSQLFTEQKLPTSVLLSDFDSPLDPALSKFGSAAPLNLEYNIATGDSGGGAFIDFGNGPVLVGVNSFLGAFEDWEHPTGDGLTDGTYGDFSGFTRVSSHLNWINSIVFPAPQIRWAGAAGAQWKVGSPGFDDAGGAPVLYQDGARVRFGPGLGTTATVDIAGPVAPQNVEVEVAHGETYTFASANGQGKITGQTGLTKLDGGRLVIRTPNDYTGTTMITGGDVVFAVPQNIGNVTVQNAVLTVEAPSRLRTLRNDNGTVVLGPGSGTTIIDGLQMVGGAATINLNDNSLVVNYAGTSIHDQLRAWVEAGEAGEAGLLTYFDGPAGSPPVTLAVVDNNHLRAVEWDGVVISDGADFDQVIVAYALLGDVNLDGTVDVQDYANLVANMNNAGTWFHGDLDRDGMVTSADHDIVTANLGRSLPGAAHAMVTVPEPGMISLLLVGCAALLGRRGRRNSLAT